MKAVDFVSTGEWYVLPLARFKHVIGLTAISTPGKFSTKTSLRNGAGYEPS